MSRDIRSYFGTAIGYKKNEDKKKSEVNNESKKKKKRCIVLESDSDEEDPVPKRKKHVIESDDEDNDFKKTPDKKDVIKPVRKKQPVVSENLKQVSAADIFGREPVKRSTTQTFGGIKSKPSNGEKKAPKEKHLDSDFEATLEQLDRLESHQWKKRKVGDPEITSVSKRNDSSSQQEEVIKSTKTPTKDEKTVTPKKEEKHGKMQERRTSLGKSPASSSPVTRKRTPQKPSCEADKTTPAKVSKAATSFQSPTSPVDPLEKKKQQAALYFKYLHREGPRNPGSKEIPEGKPNCLAGLVFVISGILDSLDRDEAANLIQKCGGRVTGSVSSKTSYVVVGDDPGQSKMEKAKKFNTKQIDEDGLLDLIRSKSETKNKTSPDKPDKKKKTLTKKIGKEKAAVEKETIASRYSEPREADGNNKLPHRTEKRDATIPSVSAPPPSSTKRSPHSKGKEFMLWVDKYKPESTKQIIGQQGDRSCVKKLLKWLADWHKNHSGDKKLQRPSPWAKNDDGAFFKAALLSGPPGVGKTTSAQLVCKELGFDVVEFNASDTRSKKLLQQEVSELLTSKSLAGYFHSGLPSQPTAKHVLLMDEVDGMAGNEDRGGIQELIQLVKLSRIPVICMCNDRNHPKIRSLVNYCFDLRFQKPRLEQIRGAMMSICFKEGIKIQPDALNEIIMGSNQDLRQILHHLSVWSAKEKNLTSEQAKLDAEKSKKHIKLGPWDVVKKVFSAQDHKSMSIHDKSDLFFHDYSIGPLFVQENYLSVCPHAAKGNLLDTLILVSKTADSISISNMVDSTMRSTNSWSLLPVQAVFASIVPGELMEGHITSMINFPAWLGKNSRQRKFDRILQELQMHMRLSISGSKQALNMDYLTHIRDAIVSPLVREGNEGVPESLQVLQEYNLLRDDLEGIMELSSWPGQKDPMSQVESKVKAAFTRAYNKEGIMTPYAVTAPVKKKGRASASQDSTLEDEEFEELEEDDEGDDNEDDVTADAMIKAKKKKMTGSKEEDAGPSEKGKGRGRGGRSRGK